MRKFNFNVVNVVLFTALTFIAAAKLKAQVSAPSADKLIKPKAIYTPIPDYPESARKSGVEGKIEVHFTVGTDGRPHDVIVKKGLTPEINKATIEGVNKWRFKPATRNGQPIDYDIDAQLSFRKAQ